MKTRCRRLSNPSDSVRGQPVRRRDHRSGCGVRHCRVAHDLVLCGRRRAGGDRHLDQHLGSAAPLLEGRGGSLLGERRHADGICRAVRMEADLPGRTDRVVFTLTVNGDGSWSFDLDDQLDHVAGSGDAGFELRTRWRTAVRTCLRSTSRRSSRRPTRTATPSPARPPASSRLRSRTMFRLRQTTSIPPVSSRLQQAMSSPASTCCRWRCQHHGRQRGQRRR